MMLHYKRNRLNRRRRQEGIASTPRLDSSGSSTHSNNHQAMHVKNYMQSIDPSRCRDNKNTTAEADKPASLPFFPDHESFDASPASKARAPLQRSIRGTTEKQQQQQPSSSSSSSSPSEGSITSASSIFPSPPSNGFYPSNRLRLKSNPVQVPCPRKTLFFSSTHALACPLPEEKQPPSGGIQHPSSGQDSRNTAGSTPRSKHGRSSSNLLSFGSANSRVVPFEPGTANQKKKNNNTNTNNKIDYHKNHLIHFSNSTERYRGFSQDSITTTTSGLFEADSPAMSNFSSVLLPELPSTPLWGTQSSITSPYRGLLTPPDRVSLVSNQMRWGATPNGGTPLVPSYASFTPTSANISTPQRVSMDVGNRLLPVRALRDDGIAGTPLRQAFVPAPKLCLQPSVGTATAASTLLSMMVTATPPPHDGSHNTNKRSLDPRWTFGPPSIKRSKPTTPKRTLGKSLLSPPPLGIDAFRIREDGENCGSLSNRRSGGRSLFRAPAKAGTPHRRQDQHSPTKRSFSTPPPESPPAPFPEKTMVVQHNQGSKPSPPASPADSHASVVCKRIPRRFIDDPSPILSGMRLAAPDDAKHLNSLHCFVRSQLLEVFVLEHFDPFVDNGGDDAPKKPRRGAGKAGRKKNSAPPRGRRIQRVGLRCVHCGCKPKHERSGASMSSFYPKSVQDIYRGVCTWQRIHFKACRHVPNHLKDEYKRRKESDRSRGKKAHWIRSALDMGLRNLNEFRNGVIWVGTDTGEAPSVSLDLTIEEGNAQNLSQGKELACA